MSDKNTFCKEYNIFDVEELYMLIFPLLCNSNIQIHMER